MGIFRELSSWESKEVCGRHGCGIWNSISLVKDDFWKFIKFRLGEGNEIRFWEDKWLGEATLRESFGSLISLVEDPLVLVVDCFDSSSNIWMPRFHRNLNDWEVEEMVRLLKLLEGVHLVPLVRDGWEWVLNKKGIFNSKSLYCELMNHWFTLSPHKRIRIPSIPSKVCFFIWNAYLDKIMTLNHLQSRG